MVVDLADYGASEFGMSKKIDIWRALSARNKRQKAAIGSQIKAILSVLAVISQEISTAQLSDPNCKF